MKKIKFVVIVLLLFLIPVKITNYEIKKSEYKENIKEIEENVVEKIEEKETLHPSLKKVCSCESTGRPDKEPQHYENDGVTVRYGRINPLDKGLCQINLFYHEETATKMGLDLLKEEDNIKYANYLYEKEGLTPWRYSSSCWGEKESDIGKSSIMVE